MYRGTKMKMTVDISLELTQARKQWRNFYTVLKEKKS